MAVPTRELRAWARGDYPTEAADELLIRAKGGRFAHQTQPWVEPLEPSTSLCRINWNRLHDELGVFSGDELAATAHAAGRPRLLSSATPGQHA